MIIGRPVERQRVVTQRFRAKRLRASGPLGSQSVTILGGFALILAVGTAILVLPWSSADREATNVYDAFFTAVSAMTVTGLVVVDTQTHYSFLGEATIALLIQIGGLGYMLGSSMVLWVLGRRLGLRDRYMLRQYYGAPSMAEALTFAKRVALYAFVLEAVGWVLLWVAFVIAGESATRSIWWGLFHSVSAFNNAGFNVTGADMLPFRDDTPVLMVISSLVILGGLGAIPVLALLEKRSFQRLPVDAKLILLVSAALLVVGTLFIASREWSNEGTLGTVNALDRLPLAFFQAAMPRTAGFSAIDVDLLNEETHFFQIGLMFIGGSAGSVAGGIKVGTFAILLVALVATLRGREEVVLFNREIRPLVIRQALTVALLGVAVAFTTATLLTVASPDLPFLDLLFESVSALATVGHSAGITDDLSSAGRAIIIVAMLVGRFGPLILVLEMTRPRRRSPYRLPEDSIRLG